LEFFQIRRGSAGFNPLDALAHSRVSGIMLSRNFAIIQSCCLNADTQQCHGSIMTTFDEREHAFEAKLAHDEELKFKARARRDKKLGLWAAGKLGKTGAAAEDYASRLVATAIAKDSAGQILKTIRADFDRAGVDIPDHEIRRKMDELLVAAGAVQTCLKLLSPRASTHRLIACV
jgi:hypothetical protein